MTDSKSSERTLSRRKLLGIAAGATVLAGCSGKAHPDCDITLSGTEGMESSDVFKSVAFVEKYGDKRPRSKIAVRFHEGHPALKLNIVSNGYLVEEDKVPVGVDEEIVDVGTQLSVDIHAVNNAGEPLDTITVRLSRNESCPDLGDA